MELVKFDDVKVCDVVEINNTYYHTCAVGIVIEKIENVEYKAVKVQFGFDRKNLQLVVLEYKFPPKGEQILFVTNILQ